MFRNKTGVLMEPPVVPGPDGANRGPAPACDACGSDSANRTAGLLEGIAAVLCVDACACALRYRRGVSPATYAAGLRGELLAVAP